MERPWLSASARAREAQLQATLDGRSPDEIDAFIWNAIDKNRLIHDELCLSLDPAANVMNPTAEKALAAGLSSRPSLGWPGDKYETGLEGIEQVEVAAMRLACDVFGAQFAEVRVASGAIGNLYCFMALCAPGDSIIVPPASIGGHVTHHPRGAAGLYGLKAYEAPIDPEHYTIDPVALAELVQQVKPRLVTVGGSLNLFPHPVQAIADIAHAAGAKVMYDAAHVSGLLAGKVWPNPLDLGADVVSMSTYKSLGGPAGGLVLTNDAELAERIDAIAHPGLTANFDAGVTAALALSLLDWKVYGREYAQAFVGNAIALGLALQRHGLPVFSTPSGITSSHQLAIRAETWGGGDQAAQLLRRANLLASGIGLPNGSGLRLGTSEPTRWGYGIEHMVIVADHIAAALLGDDDMRASTADAVSRMKRQFSTVRYVRSE